MMEFKEFNTQITENPNDIHTLSEAGADREKDSKEQLVLDQKEISNKNSLGVYLEKSTLGPKDHVKFSEDFIKPIMIEGWDMRLSNMFSNPQYNTYPPYLSSPSRNTLNNMNFIGSIDYSDKFGISNVEKKSKNIFFKTTKKNLFNGQKIKKNSCLETKNEVCVTFKAKENFQEEKQFLSKKTKFKENNIDLLLCNYFYLLLFFLNDLFLAASDLLIKNGVLNEIDQIIRANLMNPRLDNEKEKNFLDLIEASSSNSNSNSSTKYHNIKNNSISKKKCQNEACESLNKNILKVSCPSLSKKNNINWLCKLCLDAFKQNKYCNYCYFIYHSATNDKKSWIQCDYCSCWNHVQCEETKGVYKNILKNNIKGGLKYKCPVCRGKTSLSKMKLKNKSSPLPKISKVSNEATSDYFKTNRKVSNCFDEKLPLSNHLYLLSTNDNREIYHDLMKIKNNQDIMY